jgi:hypothetical protein
MDAAGHLIGWLNGMLDLDNEYIGNLLSKRAELETNPHDVACYRTYSRRTEECSYSVCNLYILEELIARLRTPHVNANFSRKEVCDSDGEDLPKVILRVSVEQDIGSSRRGHRVFIFGFIDHLCERYGQAMVSLVDTPLADREPSALLQKALGISPRAPLDTKTEVENNELDPFQDSASLAVREITFRSLLGQWILEVPAESVAQDEDERWTREEETTSLMSMYDVDSPEEAWSRAQEDGYV